MSDAVAARLSKFTPDATSLDRDALLFAAGRASVRPHRRWKALAGALALSQLMTLGLLWFHNPEVVLTPTPAPKLVVTPEPTPPDEPTFERDAPGLWTLREQVFAADGNLPSPPSVEQMVSSEPPLRAFTASPAAILP